MAHAVSSPRTQPTGLASDEDARERAACDLRDRLADHGAVFYRTILDGAFERIYRPDGSYRLREIGSGLYLEEVLNLARTRPGRG